MQRCALRSLILLWREYENLARASTIWRGVGGLCIIDEALYRQTELNAEMLAAQPHRRVGGGGSKEQPAPLLTLYICREESGL